MGKNELLAGCEDLVRDLSAVKTGWNIGDERERKAMLGPIKKDIRELRAGNISLTRRQIFSGIFDIFSAQFRASNVKEQENFLVFATDTAFFMLVRDIIGDSSRDILSVGDASFASFFNSVPEPFRNLRTAFSTLIIEFLSVRMQRQVFRMIQKEKKSLEYRFIVEGIFCGGVRYDEVVYEIFCRKIESSDRELLESVTRDNPVYVVGIMYMRGFLNEYDMKRFEPYCDRSDMLCMCVFPESFKWEKYRREWKELLFQPKIAGCIRRERVRLDI